ncbi:hypothetical protein FEM48_Zijuj12G0161100 [Ziziphus jujuba var. spinosa]|uniref:Mesoderm development candidate 2 n=1 Tax=Ziziphus jujuba var. spinosa TaxID=714518 RepID=A0A978UEB1_ZIZJJ|nr:hypothetical protein FEM48_Zijuj12G0161100 [Ziziphus jujuba var. spinosa]
MANCRAFMSSIFPALILILPLIFSLNGEFVRFAEAGKRRAQISDDLDDVVDDEEDESWKEWGKKSTPSMDLDPSDLSEMDLPEIQSEMMKRHSGPVFGFVKLRLGVKRTQDVVTETAMKWTKVIRTGGVEAKFMGLDLTTIMFSMENGQNIPEVCFLLLLLFFFFSFVPFFHSTREGILLKEFVLSQPEAYELKIGDQVFRRPGDPPLEEVVEKLHEEKNKEEKNSHTQNENNVKEEL